MAFSASSSSFLRMEERAFSMQKITNASKRKLITPEFDSYFWAKDRPDLSLSQKIFTVNVA